MNKTVLTVGDLRKALAKYDDDTIVSSSFGSDYDSRWSCYYPVDKKDAIYIKEVKPKDLFFRQWLGLDLSNRKVVNIDTDFTALLKYECETENAHPFWKPYIEKAEAQVRKMRPLSYYI